jgi:hypothetical protein
MIKCKTTFLCHIVGITDMKYGGVLCTCIWHPVPTMEIKQTLIDDVHDISIIQPCSWTVYLWHVGSSSCKLFICLPQWIKCKHLNRQDERNYLDKRTHLNISYTKLEIKYLYRYWQDLLVKHVFLLQFYQRTLMSIWSMFWCRTVSW